MLKKVMIICLALSFVFVGGIGFALAGVCDGTQKGKDVGPGPHGPVGPGDGTCDFISPDSNMILADDDCLGPPDGAGSGKGGPYGPRGDECPNFISHDSSIIIAHGYDEDNGNGDQDTLRDGFCQD